MQKEVELYGRSVEELRGEELRQAIAEAGGQRAAAKAWGIPRSTLQDRLKIGANGRAEIDNIEVLPAMKEDHASFDIEGWQHRVSPFQVISTVAQKVTATSLTVRPDATFEDVKVLSQALGRVEGSVGLWRGDVIRYAESRWGEKYTQMVEVTGLNKGSLQNNVYTAENVAPEVRRPELSAAHHYAVARIKDDDPEKRMEKQAKWLKIAVEESLSVNDLRDRMEEADRQEYMQSTGRIEATTPETPDRKIEVERHKCGTCGGSGWVETVVEYD